MTSNRSTLHCLAALACLAVLWPGLGGAAEAAPTADGALSLYGITLYGTLDAGVQYNTASAPSSDYHVAGGTESIIAKNAVGSVTAIGGSYLSQSKLGLKGEESFGNGWSGVFRLETFFNPWSGHISDAEKSMTLNNGKVPAAQTTWGDSSIAGQLFGGAAYVGITHAQWGTLTLGRQNSVVADGINKYDPMNSSQAFSPLGWSGTAAGAGDTENRRLDGSVKYEVTASGIHVEAQYQPTSGTNPGTSAEFAVGWKAAAGSIDAFYSKKNDAIAAAPLTAAQVASLAQVCAGATVAGFSCAAIDKALVGTISDNTAYALMAQYQVTPVVKLSAGFEQIQYRNPSHPVAAGQNILGGYTLVFINPPDKSFPKTKNLSISWLGAKFSPGEAFDLIASLYRYDQNSYATGANAECTTTASSACSGSEDFASVVGIYKVTKRFNVYGGAMWSNVQNGLASGFAFHTSDIDPTIGFRYNF